jgi:hypothetical protein
MKVFNIISWVFLVSGISLKYFGLPGNMIMLFAVLLMLIYSVIYLALNATTNIEKSIANFAVTFLSLYFIVRILSWPISFTTLGVACLSSIASIILMITNKVQIKIPQILFLIYFAFIIAISFVPTDVLYDFFH